MKYVFKSKRNYNISLKQIVSLVIILISSLTIFLLVYFSKNLSNTLLDISSNELDRYLKLLITDKINNQVLNKNNLTDILVIKTNANDEILYVDFDLDKAYQVLDTVSNVLTTSLKDIEEGSINLTYLDKSMSYQTNSFVLSIPLGSLFNNPYLYNIGPRIPVEINFMGSILTNLETKVTNYGLNNALVELYVYIDMSSSLVSFNKQENVNLKYNALIASMMVEGEVPNFYNGEIEAKSNVYQKNIDN